VATSGVSLLARFFGNTISEAAAFGAGLAIGPVLKPPVRLLESTVWQAYPDQPLDPGTAAAVAAERVSAYGAMETEASMNGINASRFADMYGERLTAPGVGELLTLLRRGDINAGNFQHGLDKAKLEAMWGGPLAGLQVGRLSPQEVATMVQRGILPNNGILPVAPPVGGGTVPPMPMVNIDPFTEAAAGGYDNPRIEALARIVGLPPAPGELLQMLNRGIIDATDFARGISEGNTRNEWTPFLQQLQRRLLTPHEYAELELRGFIGAPARDTGAALSGMTAPDTQHLYDLLGRSLSVHALTTALARGGVWTGNPTSAPQPYLAAIQRSNIRPEYYDLAYANRYSYPSGFQIRAETQNGTLSQTQAEQVLLEIGWSPKWALVFSTAWAGGGGPVADPHVKKAQTQLWGTIHRSYLAGESTAAEVTAGLPEAGVAVAAVPAVLAVWDAEQTFVRRQLTPAQIKKAYTETTFTLPEAVGRLVSMGYSVADAGTFLGE
jgi:hypothetical protein